MNFAYILGTWVRSSHLAVPLLGTEIPLQARIPPASPSAHLCLFHTCICFPSLEWLVNSCEDTSLPGITPLPDSLEGKPASPRSHSTVFSPLCPVQLELSEAKCEDALKTQKTLTADLESMHSELESMTRSKSLVAPHFRDGFPTSTAQPVRTCCGDRLDQGIPRAYWVPHLGALTFASCRVTPSRCTFHILLDEGNRDGVCGNFTMSEGDEGTFVGLLLSPGLRGYIYLELTAQYPQQEPRNTTLYLCF